MCLRITLANFKHFINHCSLEEKYNSYYMNLVYWYILQFILEKKLVQEEFELYFYSSINMKRTFSFLVPNVGRPFVFHAGSNVSIPIYTVIQINL